MSTIPSISLSQTFIRQILKTFGIHFSLKYCLYIFKTCALVPCPGLIFSEIFSDSLICYSTLSSEEHVLLSMTSEMGKIPLNPMAQIQIRLHILHKTILVSLPYSSQTSSCLCLLLNREPRSGFKLTYHFRLLFYFWSSVVAILFLIPEPNPHSGEISLTTMPLSSSP